MSYDGRILLRGGKTCETQQPDKLVDTGVPDTGIRIGAVMYEVLVRWGETFDTQQSAIRYSPTTWAPGQIFDEVKLLASLENSSTDPKMKAKMTFHLAMATKLGASHPIATPTK